MPAEILYEPQDIVILRFTGILMQSEFAAQQGMIAEKIETGANPRLLVLLENFKGWEQHADWNDLDFLFSHSQKIAKIAIVGEPRWEVKALAFAGAGLRRAQVKFFPPDQASQARLWLAE